MRIGGRISRTQYQLTLQDADVDELNVWAGKILDRLKTLPQLRDVATDQQNQGTTLTLTIDRDQASRLGIQPQVIDDTLYDAFGQRQVTQYFTQTNTYRVILEVPSAQQGSIDTLNTIYVKSPSTNSNVPMSSFVHWTTVPVRPLSISHEGQFPAVTLSFNLAPGTSLGEATTAIDPNETSQALEERLSRIGADLLVTTVERMTSGPVAEEAQDPSLVTYASRLERGESVLADYAAAGEDHRPPGLRDQRSGAVEFIGRTAWQRTGPVGLRRNGLGRGLLEQDVF